MKQRQCFSFRMQMISVSLPDDCVFDWSFVILLQENVKHTMGLMTFQKSALLLSWDLLASVLHECHAGVCVRKGVTPWRVLLKTEHYPNFLCAPRTNQEDWLDPAHVPVGSLHSEPRAEARRVSLTSCSHSFSENEHHFLFSCKYHHFQLGTRRTIYV